MQCIQQYNSIRAYIVDKEHTTIIYNITALFLFIPFQKFIFGFNIIFGGREQMGALPP